MGGIQKSECLELPLPSQMPITNLLESSSFASRELASKTKSNEN